MDGNTLRPGERRFGTGPSGVIWIDKNGDLFLKWGNINMIF